MFVLGVFSEEKAYWVMKDRSRGWRRNRRMGVDEKVKMGQSGYGAPACLFIPFSGYGAGRRVTKETKRSTRQ